MIDIEDVKLLEIGPGQVLVIKCDGFINHDIEERVRQKIERQVPSLKDRLLIIDKTISLAVVDGGEKYV